VRKAGVEVGRRGVRETGIGVDVGGGAAGAQADKRIKINKASRSFIAIILCVHLAKVFPITWPSQG
jgi:hypothetical protein